VYLNTAPPISLRGDFLELKVLKKMGQMEAFSTEKIKNGIIKAGGTAKLARSVALNTAKWAKETAKEGVISTVEIHRKVVELLAEKDKEVAEKFKSFVKTR
jgi:transcriptional regulator NrdR family protein